MRERVRGVAKLIDIKAARSFPGQSCSNVLVIFRVAARHIRPGDPHFGPECSHVGDLFLRHLVRNHEQDAITLGTGNKRKTESSIPCCGFNDRATGL